MTSTRAAYPQRMPPPRLVVDNRTPVAADVYAWKFNGREWNWHYVMRLPGRTWAPVYNVYDGDRFRAAHGDHYHNHEVELDFDPEYGGGQDVWWIR
jgi:hypothetical protein